MNGKSFDTKENVIEKLKTIAPQVFSEDKIDWEKLKSTFGDEINFSDERYVLNWAGKSDAFRAIQTQTTATLIPDKDESVKFDETGNLFIEGENLEVLKVLQKAYYGKIKMIYIDPPYNTGNDFIYNDKFAEKKNEYLLRSGEKDEEGLLTNENLYRKNSKENGHYHSNWLTMMYPRLFLARNLLRDDGVIFVSIDDNEAHNLRMIMNEIFGEENFVAQFIWEKIHSTKNDAKNVSDNHEYILLYSKNIVSLSLNLLPRTKKMDARYQNPDNDVRGLWSSGDLVANEERKGGYYIVKGPSGKSFNVPSGKHWVYSKENMIKFINDNRIWFGNKGTAFPRLKRFLSEVQQGKKIDTIWKCNEVGHNQEAKREIKKIFDNKSFFDTPKPIRLLNRMLNIGSNNNDIILDFFSGSSTTAHAVLDLNREDGGNRKFIMVQLPEKTDIKSEAYKAGYETIADIGKERIRRVIKKIESEPRIDTKKHEKEQPEIFRNDDKISDNLSKSVVSKQDLGFKVFKLQESNFKIWRGDTIKTGEELEEQLKAFVNPVKEGSAEENILYELLLKSGMDLNCRIEKIPLSLVAPERFKGGRGMDFDLSGDGVCYYLINENELVIALSKINEDIVKNIIESKPQKVITLDKLFAENDQLKTNTILQMKDAGIEFKVV